VTRHPPTPGIRHIAGALDQVAEQVLLRLPQPPCVVQLVRLVAAIRSGDFDGALRLCKDIRQRWKLSIVALPGCHEALIADADSARQADPIGRPKTNEGPTLLKDRPLIHKSAFDQGTGSTPPRGQDSPL